MNKKLIKKMNSDLAEEQEDVINFEKDIPEEEEEEEESLCNSFKTNNDQLDINTINLYPLHNFSTKRINSFPEVLSLYSFLFSCNFLILFTLLSHLLSRLIS